MALRLCVLLLALVLAGCGGDDDEPEASATTGAPEATSCVPATSDIMAPVGGRVALENADVRLQNGQLVESNETPGIWFLSAELDGPGLEDEGDVATWATTSQFGGEAIYSVDELAGTVHELQRGGRRRRDLGGRPGRGRVSRLRPGRSSGSLEGDLGANARPGSRARSRPRSLPSRAARRSAKPCRPLPSVASAPPTPSSSTSTTRRPSEHVIRTAAADACAYLATLVSASTTT